MFKHKRRELTEKEEKWLRAHFKHTKNDDIMTKLGITFSHLHMLARLWGLKKSREFMKKTQQNATLCATASWQRMKKEDPERYKSLRDIARANLRFDDHNIAEYTKNETKKQKAKRIAAMRVTMSELRKREQARESAGLPRQTKLKLKKGKFAKDLYKVKWYLTHRYSYIAGKGLTMYYAANTRRTPKEQHYIDRYKLRFKPEEEEEPRKEVKLPPDWKELQGGLNTSFSFFS